MRQLRIEHVENDWQIASVHYAPRAGGWESVEALQQSNFARCWHPPKLIHDWMTGIEMATPVDGGVLLSRLDRNANKWVPHCKVTIVEREY